MGPLHLSLRAAILRSSSWFLSKKLQPLPVTALAIALLFSASPGALAQGKIASTTVLSVTANGSSATTAASGTVVTLTATVTAASGTLKTGQVNFCDASAKYCTDIHLLATAQLTSAGTATLKFRPGIGSHSYKAEFVGTNAYAGSSSSASALTVTGTVAPFATTTAIAKTGSWGNYALTGTVTEAGGTTAPTGTISFLDASNGNSVLATGALGTAVAGVGWPNPQSISGAYDTRFVLVADMNGDGIPDVVDSQNPVVIYLGNANGTYSEAPALPSLATPPAGPMVVADFNGDGIPDLALGMYESTTVSILLGKGDGTFAAPIAVSLPSGTTNPSQVLAADLNGDGIPDLVVVNNEESKIDILLGNGDGTFTPAAAPSISVSPSCVAVGDFNGDGKTDLAISDLYSDSIAILSGNGDGTFTTVGTAHSGTQNAPIAAADFNADGKLDLAAATGGSSGTAESITILTGNGDGTFTSPSSSQSLASTTVTSILIADFNQGGVPDAVLADSGGNATVLLNNGRGLFSVSFPVVTGPSNPTPLMVGVGDLNGDGYPDIAAGSYYITLDLLLTEPTETATTSATISIATPGTHLADASYAGDSNYNSSVSSTTPLWGTPPTTATALTLTSGGSAVTSVAPGTVVALTATVKIGAASATAGQVNFCDASAIHCTDVHIVGTASLTSNGTATFKFVPGPGTHSYFAEYLENGQGAGSISTTVNLTVGPAPSPKYTDMTSTSESGFPGDYSLTATVVGFGGPAAPTGNVSFLDTSFGNTALATAPLGTATGSLGWLISQTPAVGGTVVSEVTADFNQDGIPDLAVLWTPSSGGTNGVTVFFGNGDGTFKTGPTTQISTATWFSGAYLLAGDFNGDGKTDLALLYDTLTSSDSAYVTTYLGNGDGTFGSPQTSTVSNQGAAGGDYIQGAMVAGDFNGDGKLDLAVIGDYVGSGGVIVMLGNGDGTLSQTPPIVAPAAGFSTVATGDFNGDGIPDLVAIPFLSGNATVFLGKGDGTFTILAPLVADSRPDAFPTSIAVGDYNGDGVLDLAFGDDYGVSICLGNGDGTFNQTSSVANNSGAESLLEGDFNHDGKVDLAAIDNYNDQVDLYMGAGDGTFSQIVPTANVSPESNAPTFMVAADFDQTGVSDIALLNKYVDTVSILLTEPTQTATATVTGIAPIGAGTHNVEASYAGDSNYPASTSSTVALTAGLAPLVITPAPGNYSSVQSVTITESIPGATIYYAEYGTVSTAGYVPYTGPIPLIYGGPETIYAYASETGYDQSSESIVNYTLTFPQTAAPTVSPAPGYYAGAQTVTITDSDPTAQIYYTINGAIPTLSSTLYTGPITVSSSETVVARAISSGHAISQWVNAQYIIGSSSVPMIYSIAGTGSLGYSGDGGPASLAQMDYPDSAVEDAAGNIYFSDEGNHMVRKIAAGTGIISVVAGNGYSGYSGDGGSATSAELTTPTVLAFDHAGNLYIFDAGNVVIRSVNLSSGVISTYAGNATATSEGDGGPATAAALGYVEGIAVDASNNLYIASESWNTIRVVNAATGVISTLAGTQQAYNPTAGIGDGGPASGATFHSLAGLAFDASGNLYIADAGFDIVRKIMASGGVVSPSSIIITVAGTVPAVYGLINSGYQGDGGPATSALLNYPSSVTLDSAGNLFIADYNNGVIREVASATGIINTYAGNGALCNPTSGDGGPAASASLCYASTISVDKGGNLLLADETQHIREVFAAAPPASQPAATPAFSVPAGNYMTPQSVTITDATPGASIYVTVDGTDPVAGGPAGYSLPVNIAATVTLKAVAIAPGSLVSAPVTATYNIGAFAPLISTVAGNGTQGVSPAGGPALSLSMDWPRGLAIDKAGNLYIADTENQVIWKVTAATGQASLYAGTSGSYGYTGDGGPATSAELNSPQSLALDSSGNLYIADTLNSVIREVVAATGTIKTVAGSTYVYGAAIGDGGPATSAALLFPNAIAFDGAGNLYISDTYHERIRMVAAATGIITTVAGNGTTVESGDGGPATSAGILIPNSVAVDGAGNIYIGVYNGGTIRKVTAATGIIGTTAGVKNLPGTTGDGSPAAGAEVFPYSLTVDSAGDLFIANIGEVREINAATGAISSVAGIGYPGYSGDGGAATAAEVDSVGQLALDAAGNLYFTDGVARIRRAALAAQTVATPAFNPVAGPYTAAQSVSITDGTPGAAIYYTTDGSTPTNASAAYTTPIAVGASETIKAVAIEVGYYPSAVASAAYAINIAPAASTLLSLSPAHTSAAGAQFTLTVNGSGFAAGSVVDWGASGLTTTFVSSTQLTAVVPASDIASPGTASITVQTPGASASNALQFQIDSAGANTPPTVTPSSNTVTAGGTVTYTVTLPSSATNVSASCLNLPAGATCSYSSSAGTLTITTASTTPIGTYVITVVFTETLPGAALILLPFLLSPMTRSKKPRNRKVLQIALFGVLAALMVVVGCGGGGGGGGGGGSTTPPATHQVTTSTTVTLVVK